MSEQQATPPPRRECLSALMDGDAQALGAACAAWRDDADARAQWHAYHLIGDVLRSEELAQSPAADALFLSTLRVRLAAEPVVLAPAARSVTAVPRRRWLASAAVAAGFVVVAGVLVVTRGVLPGDSAAPQIAAAPAPAVRAVAAEAVLADSALIRDARLDRYLSAHKQYGGSSALGLPGGVLQRASTVAPEQR
jgi:sigma-E factor negative regulatory protein RseA